MRVVDLFSGCGGLSKGFEEAGHEVILAVERWPSARAVYQANFSHPVADIDLSGVNEATALIAQGHPDLIMGGPPCQDFSVAGTRQEGEKAELTVSFASIVAEVKPRWFVLENVPGVAGSQAWATATKILTLEGYGISQHVLNAAHYGVPQNRKRFFAVGCLGERDDFLAEGIEEGKTLAPLSVRQYLGDELGVEFYYRHPRTWGRRGVFSLDEPSPTIRSTNRPVPPGYKPHPKDAAPVSGARALTPHERARIQTFGREFELFGSATDQNMMIANAVPVNLAKHVACILGLYHEEKSMMCDPKFRPWLESSQNYTPRTISNVISRVKRATRILQWPRLPKDPLDSIHALERSCEFNSLTSSVRSQIKKAIRLHSEFLSK